MNLFHGSFMKTDPCLYFFEYSPDVLKKKTKLLDIFNTDKKCFIKNLYRNKSSIDMDKDPFSQRIRIPITASRLMSLEKKGKRTVKLA